MGSIFKKQTTRQLPPRAEVLERKGERIARWKAGERTRTATVTTGQDGSERILVESTCYFAKYRDGAGVVRVVPTRCRDEQAARAVLARLERRAELVRSGVVTTAEDAIARHQGTSFEDHLAGYLAYLESAGTCPEHRQERGRQLRRLATDCGWRTLADLQRDSLERWLTLQTRQGMGARTRNSYLVATIAFSNWAIETGRMLANPFERVPRLDEKTDPRRQRRAMTGEELSRLLAVARERPMIDATTVRKGPRRGERYANVRPEVRDRLDLLGRERALIYKTLVLTGLRKGELASLTAGQVHLDDEPAFIELDAADEKNREGSTIALRPDLAEDLRGWLAGVLARMQDEARDGGDPIPARLPSDTPLFVVPDKLCKIMNRDLRLAGIAKRDDRGRVLDVHALRTTFGTLLSKGGVLPRTAQAAMRHSKIDLTMNVYTDPRLLDVAGALNALPDLPLDARPGAGEALQATGTTGETARAVAPAVAPTSGNPRLRLASCGNSSITERKIHPSAEPVASRCPDTTKHPLSSTGSGCEEVGATGLEPVTPSVSSKRIPLASIENKELTASDSSGCTTGCTSETKTPPDLARLADLWDTLSQPIRDAILAIAEANGPARNRG